MKLLPRSPVGLWGVWVSGLGCMTLGLGAWVSGVWVEGLPPLRLWGFPKIGRPQNRTLNSGILITRTPK